MLLILDNFEHLMNDSDLINECLQAAPRVHLLVTSRHRLNLHGENVLPLQGMDLPVPTGSAAAINYAAETEKSILQSNAVQLFLQNVRSTHGRQITFGASDLAVIAHICHLVQGMPLAILLASTWVDLLSPSEIAAEIAQDVAFLAVQTGREKAKDSARDPEHELPSRQHSMHIIFNYSWNLLTLNEQQIFGRMSIFRGGCTRAVAQQVSGGTLRELLTLVHKSLLVRDISSGRFTIHELLRQMAAEKLVEMGQSAPPLHRLAVETLERLYAQNLTPYYGELADHAEQAGLSDKARQYLHLAGNVARDLYQNNLALQQYRRALQLTPAAEQAIIFQLYMERQAILHRLGRREAQASELTILSQLATALQDERKQSESLICQARYAEALGKYADAAQAAQGAVTLATAAEANDLLALGNLAWGVALGRENAFDAARARLEAAVDFAEIAALPLIAADSLRNLGIDAAYQRHYEQARDYFEQNLQIYRRIGNRPDEAAGLGNLGTLALLQCDYPGARLYLEQAVAIFRQIGDLRSEAIGLNNLGVVAHKVDMPAEAQQHLEQALHIAQQIDDQQSQREAHNLLGHLFSDQAQHAQASTHYAQALQLAQALQSPGHILESQVGLAATIFGEGDQPRAYALLCDVLADINEPLLAQTEDALRIYVRAYRILVAHQDARANQMLTSAFHHLQQQASQIADAARRALFLQASPIHHEIIAEFAKQQPGGIPH